MSKNKCCGNCARFFNEDAKGNGFCSISPNRQVVTYRHSTCIAHEWKLPKWTEITPDNEHELTDSFIGRAVIGWLDSCNRQHIVAFADCAMGVGTMAKYGGYWYYVLPELKIE